MSAPETDSSAARQERFTPEELQRISAVMNGLRAGGVHAVRAWIEATEAGLGGKLVLQAPTRTNGKGHLVEAAYQSQYWVTLAGADVTQ